MKTIDEYFPDTYEESRETFRGNLEKIRLYWPDAEVTTRPIGQEEDNTIDMIYSPGTETNERILLITAGEHGIEGYAGAAMLDVFVQEMANQMDSKRIGICLIHAVNPWGMRNFRRVTENNIDLNRNYLVDPEQVPRDVNEHYENVMKVFLPDGVIDNYHLARIDLQTKLARGLVSEGYYGLTKAKGMGQYEFPTGVYYGGKEKEENTQFLQAIQEKLLYEYPRVIHIDWHTALGPTNEVTMLMSEDDGRTLKELKKTYGLKNIQQFTPEKAKGDSTHHFYALKNRHYPDTYLFSALFEFGTFGTSVSASLREFMTIILENRLHHEGAVHEKDRQAILDEFKAMFYPEDHEWRLAVLTEGRKAMKSLLQNEGLFTIRG